MPAGAANPTLGNGNDQQELGWGWEGAGAAWRLSQSLVLSAELAAGSKEFMEVLMLCSIPALLLLLRLHRASCFLPPTLSSFDGDISGNI